MEPHDKKAIEGLFHKLALAGQAQPHRDPEAEALIEGLIKRNPGAAYYLAQTVIMQEQALNAAQAQMEQMQQQPQQGGLFGRLFSGGQPQTNRPMMARPVAPPSFPQPSRHGQSPWSSGRPAGGGFMAGAAQTAMGVAGGVLLGNAIGSMFAGPAEAAEPLTDEPAVDEEAGYDDTGFDDGGFEE